MLSINPLSGPDLGGGRRGPRLSGSRLGGGRGEAARLETKGYYKRLAAKKSVYLASTQAKIIFIFTFFYFPLPFLSSLIQKVHFGKKNSSPFNSKKLFI